MSALCKKHGMPDREERRHDRERNAARVQALHQQLALF
jgi:hypothetical protein